MDGLEATRLCGQCNKEVAEANFTLHESHCRRFLCVCPNCDEPVPKDQLKQHREEQHTQVKCSKCNQKVERCQLLDHESDKCEERLQCCQFCELEVHWKDLEEHSLACGSRTELCRDCGHYVTLRDQPQHDITCPATDAGPDPPSAVSSPPKQLAPAVMCTGCMASFPAEQIKEHESQCAPTSRLDLEEAELVIEHMEREDDLSRGMVSTHLNSSKTVFSLSDRNSREPWGDGRDPYQISTCPYCHLVLPLITLRWHKVKCQIHIHMQ